MREKKRKFYFGFIQQEVYDKISGETLWQVLMILGIGDRLLNEIRSMFVDTEACKQMKSGE